jgi:chromosome segregation ATPase
VFEQLMLSQLNTQCEQIQNANLKMTKKVQEMFDQAAEKEKENEDIRLKMLQNDGDVEAMNDAIEEVSRSIEKIEEEMKTEKESSELEERKQKLLENIANIKKEMEKAVCEFEETTASYNAKIKKEQHRQTGMGILDDEKSGNESSNDEAKSVKSGSSSIAATHITIEKTEFKIPSPHSSDENSSKSHK